MKSIIYGSLNGIITAFAIVVLVLSITNFKEEMIDIYIGKGVSRRDAETMLRAMSMYKEFFINHMMVCAASVPVHSHSLSVPCVLRRSRSWSLRLSTSRPRTAW